MRKIAEIKSDKRLQILESGFDGMACYLNDKRYRPPREMAIIASWGRRMGTRQREPAQPLSNMGRDVPCEGYFLDGR